MNVTKKIAPALLVAVSVVWGTTFFIVKDTAQSVDPFLLVAIRNLLAALPLLVYTLLRELAALRSVSALRDGAILGFLLATTYTSQTIGLQFTSSGHSAFVTGIAVVLVPFVMFVFYKYRLKFQHFVAIAVVTFGLFLLTYDSQTKVNIGDLITLVTAVSAAMHIVWVGAMSRRNSLSALVAYQFLASGLYNLVGHTFWGTELWQVDAVAWPALLYLGFVGTLFCYGVSSWAQRFVNPVAAGLIFSLEPVFAAFFSYWFAHEHLNAVEFTGAVLIMCGIAVYELPVVAWVGKLRERMN